MLDVDDESVGAIVGAVEVEVDWTVTVDLELLEDVLVGKGVEEVDVVDVVEELDEVVLEEVVVDDDEVVVEVVLVEEELVVGVDEVVGEVLLLLVVVVLLLLGEVVWEAPEAVELRSVLECELVDSVAEEVGVDEIESVRGVVVGGDDIMSCLNSSPLRCLCAARLVRTRIP
ncbi:MAG: hypothetical protein OK454_12000, partial [Thaumarchaeota archaeon]|nr:hypothetical protein [Nitrososphaerota archaeon]